MLKKSVKMLSIMLIITLLISVFAFSGSASETVIESGSCGENAIYTLYDDGTLVISGEGAMYDGEEYGYDNISGIDIPYANYIADYEKEIVGDFTVKKVIIEDGITYIGEYAFMGFRMVDSVIIPETVTEIGRQAIYCMDSLKEITIPGSVKTIGEQALGENGLEKVTICEGTEVISDYAFLYNQNLKEVIIPKSVKSLGTGAFGLCDNLEKLIVKNKHCIIGEGVLGNPWDEISTECYTTLVGYKNSTAEEYAKTSTENGYLINFEAIVCEHDFDEWVTTIEPTTEKSGEKMRTCKLCDEVETESIAVLESDIECSCMCHSENTFINFIFKILNFIWQLFGMTDNRICNCGTAHW